MFTSNINFVPNLYFGTETKAVSQFGIHSEGVGRSWQETKMFLLYERIEKFFMVFQKGTMLLLHNSVFTLDMWRIQEIPATHRR